MRRWAWWTAVGVLALGACAGTSKRRDAGGGEAGSPDGGTSGTAGTNPSTGGSAAGGTASTTGGRAGSATSGSGGSTSGAGGTSPSGGSNGGEPSGGDGGAGGEPMCTPGPTQNSCSRAATCALFSCGEPWSLYDGEGCARVRCTDTAICPAGERCVPAPVLGRYDDPAFYEPDSCNAIGDSCGCAVWEEGAPLALCISGDEFPPERDCPSEGMDCEELAKAVETVESYRLGSAFFFPYEPPAELAESVDACSRKLLELLEDICI